MKYKKLILWQAERIMELSEELENLKTDLEMYKGLYWKKKEEETQCMTTD